MTFFSIRKLSFCLHSSETFSKMKCIKRNCFYNSFFKSWNQIGFSEFLWSLFRIMVKSEEIIIYIPSQLYYILMHSETFSFYYSETFPKIKCIKKETVFIKSFLSRNHIDVRFLNIAFQNNAYLWRDYCILCS